MVRSVLGLLAAALPLLLVVNCAHHKNVQSILADVSFAERRTIVTSGSSEHSGLTTTGPPVLNPDLTSTEPPTTTDDETSTPFPDENETTVAVEDEVTTPPEEDDETTTADDEEETTTTWEEKPVNFGDETTTTGLLIIPTTTKQLPTTTAELPEKTTGPPILSADATSTPGPDIIPLSLNASENASTTETPESEYNSTIESGNGTISIPAATAAEQEYIYPVQDVEDLSTTYFEENVTRTRNNTNDNEEDEPIQPETTPPDEDDLDFQTTEDPVTTTLDKDLKDVDPARLTTPKEYDQDDDEIDHKFYAKTTVADDDADESVEMTTINPELSDDVTGSNRSVSSVSSSSRQGNPHKEAIVEMARQIEADLTTSTAPTIPPNTTTNPPTNALPDIEPDFDYLNKKTKLEPTTTSTTTTVDKSALRKILDTALPTDMAKIADPAGPITICDGKQGCFRGLCVNGRCLCDKNWVGDRCNVRACPDGCPKGSRCQGGKCKKCVGGNCDACQDTCGEHGRCVNETCYCKYGFAGPQCTRPVCPTNPQCSGHGACLLGVCICDKGFAGIACHNIDAGAPQLNNFEQLKHSRLHALLPRSESLKLSTIRSVYRSQIAELEREIKVVYRSVNQCLNKASGERACPRLALLRKQALKLNVKHKALLKKMALVEEDATNGPPSRAFGNQETLRMTRELAFAIFANQRRVTVKTGMYGLKNNNGYNASAVDAKLAEMWQGLSATEMVLFTDMAKDAIAAEQRAWAVAHELFVDEMLANIHSNDPLATLPNFKSLRGTPTKQLKTSKEFLALIDKKWAALTSQRRLEYYVNSSHLAFQVNQKNSKVVPRPIFSVLGTATNNLAFDLFAQKQWLSSFARRSKVRKKGLKGVALLSEVDQDVLSQYKKLQPKIRRVWLEKAKELLYPKLFYWQKWQNFSRHILPQFQVVGFQIGLRELAVYRPKRRMDESNQLQSMSDALQEVTADITRGGKFKLIPFDTVHAGRTRKIFSFVLVLASDAHSLSTKVVRGLTESVHSGAFRATLVTHGLQLTPYFPVGGEPHVVFGASARPKCPHDYNCTRGVCTHGICACNRGYTGHDCSERVACDCDPTRGLCDHLTGRCECYGAWTGKRCDVLACPNDCTGNGMCSNGTCICNALFKGQDCSERTCQSDCSGHGHCCFRYKCTEKTKGKPDGFFGAIEKLVGIHDKEKADFERLAEQDKEYTRVIKNPKGFTISPTCLCQKGYGGGSCGCLSESTDSECSGHGICFENQCWCRAGFAGPSCDRRTCIPDDCSGHGQCVAGACMCSTGWGSSEAGGGCNKRICPDETCSGHGVCAKGVCECTNGWEGESCETAVCPGDPQCNGHGVCVVSGDLAKEGSTCECSGEWYGDACDIRRCFRDPVSKEECNGEFGTCKDYKCECADRYVGPTCSTELCPNNCNAPLWGRCIESRWCQCAPGRTGEDCSTPTKEGTDDAATDDAATGDAATGDAATDAGTDSASKKGIKWPSLKIRVKLPKLFGNSRQKPGAKSDEEEKPNEEDGCLDCDPPQTLRDCAKCCSHTCEETCHDKSATMGHNIAAAVYSFPDCFFGCQRSCVKDCPNNPRLACGRRAADDPQPTNPPQKTTE